MFDARNADSVRRKDSKRKERRERKKERKDREKIKMAEDVKRLKNVKKTEMATKVTKIQEHAGGSGEDGLRDLQKHGLNLKELRKKGLDLDGDWDENQWDKQMQAIFDNDELDQVCVHRALRKIVRAEEWAIVGCL